MKSILKLSTLSKKQSFNTKGNVHLYERHNTIGRQLTNYKHLCLIKTKNKPNVRQGFAKTVHLVFAMENTTKPWSKLFYPSRQKKLSQGIRTLEMKKCAVAGPVLELWLLFITWPLITDIQSLDSQSCRQLITWTIWWHYHATINHWHLIAR